MEAAQLEVGRFYAYREKRHSSEPPLKVKLLAQVGRGGRVQIRFETGPFPGLDEYAHSRQLLVPWNEVKAFLRDEEHAELIKRHEKREPTDPAVATAIEIVLEATGEADLWLSNTGLASPVEPLQRVMRRSGLDGDPDCLDGLGFTDRRGEVRLPTRAAEKLARAFAAAEPESVTMYLEARESELKAQGYAPGDRFHHDYLRTQRPSFALARQWAGFEQEVETLRQEIGRLHSLVQDAVRALRDAGADHTARKLERALKGG